VTKPSSTVVAIICVALGVAALLLSYIFAPDREAERAKKQAAKLRARTSAPAKSTPPATVGTTSPAGAP